MATEAKARREVIDPANILKVCVWGFSRIGRRDCVCEVRYRGCCSGEIMREIVGSYI